MRLQRFRWEIKAMEQLSIAQTAALQRLTLDALLKKSLQLKIQVTLYAIHRAMDTCAQAAPWQNVKGFALLPILVTLAAGLASQIDLFIMCVKRQFEVHEQIYSRVPSLPEPYRTEVDASYKHLMKRSTWITVIFLFCVFVIGYSVMQIILLHTCETSLWNFAINPFDGCVTPEQLAEHGNFTASCANE